MKRSVFLTALVALLLTLFTVGAGAQLAGNDTVPGDSCTGFPVGATRMTAGTVPTVHSTTLVCDGTVWKLPNILGGTKIGETAITCNAANEGAIRYNSSTKVFEGCNGTTWASFAASLTLGDLTDVEITNPEDGVSLIYQSATNRWINKQCDDSPDTSFPNLENVALNTLTNSSIRLLEGITCATVPVSISGQGFPQYRICNDSACTSVAVNWTVATNNITAGQYMQLRLTSSAVSKEEFTATVVMGSVLANWRVKTIGPKTVFVTSTTHNGNLGGLVGADNICQVRADAAGLSGTFLAWLSDGTTSAASRMSQSTQQYVLTNGNVIANNWAELTNGSIYFAINRTETNGSASSGVWTNTSINGSIQGINHCNNWTNPTLSFNGHFGNSSQTSSQWTNSSVNACSANNRLYCVEQ